jgi:hypothetical protein
VNRIQKCSDKGPAPHKEREMITKIQKYGMVIGKSSKEPLGHKSEDLHESFLI